MTKINSTVDHLLFEAYKQLFVLPKESQDESAINNLKAEWDSQVSLYFNFVLLVITRLGCCRVRERCVKYSFHLRK